MALDVLTFLITSLAATVVLFMVALKYRTPMIPDLSYALTFIVLALYGLLAFGTSAVKVLAVCMVCAWAVRLSIYLYIRLRRRGNDHRFDAIRGNLQSFGMFWISQGIVVWAVLLPVLFLFAEQAPPLTMFSLLGIAVWGLGLGIETVADFQKYRFICDSRNQGAWVTVGLWGYSRHPNYFGEILVWSGMYLFAFPSLSGNKAVLALISPVLVFLLLRCISGVPILEKIGDARWGKVAAYRGYKQRTSLLIPLPPKHGS